MKTLLAALLLAAAAPTLAHGPIPAKAIAQEQA